MNHAHHHTGHSRSLWFLLGLTALYLLIEVIGGLWSGSLALLADAGHMAIDVASIALTLFAAWVSKKPANDKKTFGYYRAEIIAALINGSTLLLVPVGVLYEAWQRFHGEGHIHGEMMTLIAAGGFLVNLAGVALMKKHSHGNLNVRGVWLHLLSDLFGSVSAMAAGILVWRFSWQGADTVVSVGISLLIFYGAWKLVLECVDVLLDAVPKGIDVSVIRNGIQSLESVEGVHDLHVWTVSSGVPSLSVHVSLERGADSKVVLEQITRLLKESHRIEHVTIQLEPEGFVHAGGHCEAST